MTGTMAQTQASRRGKKVTVRIHGASDTPVTQAGLRWVAKRVTELFTSQDRARAGVIIFEKACQSRLILKDAWRQIAQETGVKHRSTLFQIAARMVDAGILLQATPADFQDMKPRTGKPPAIYLPDKAGLRRERDGVECAYHKAKTCPSYAHYKPRKPKD